MRDTWTDDRLTDLAGRVDAGFARNDMDIREQRAEARQARSELGAEIAGLRLELGAEIRQLRGDTSARLDRVDDRIDDLHSLLIRLAGGGLFALVATTVGSRLL